MTGRVSRGLFRLGAGLGSALALAGAAEALTRVIVLDQGHPVRLLATVHDSREDVLIALGELAFKSEFLLEGSPLRTLGAQMTCDSCHPDGGASPVVFFEGLSDKPGNLDVTNRAISLIEDNIYNPINVPSIVGARHSAPFGRDGASIRWKTSPCSRSPTSSPGHPFGFGDRGAGGLPGQPRLSRQPDAGGGGTSDRRRAGRRAARRGDIPPPVPR